MQRTLTGRHSTKRTPSAELQCGSSPRRPCYLRPAGRGRRFGVQRLSVTDLRHPDAGGSPPPFALPTPRARPVGPWIEAARLGEPPDLALPSVSQANLIPL
jgi:hypothetical protein